MATAQRLLAAYQNLMVGVGGIALISCSFEM
jgi:hypothetical protein